MLKQKEEVNVLTQTILQVQRSSIKHHLALPCLQFLTISRLQLVFTVLEKCSSVLPILTLVVSHILPADGILICRGDVEGVKIGAMQSDWCWGRSTSPASFMCSMHPHLNNSIVSNKHTMKHAWAGSAYSLS